MEDIVRYHIRREGRNLMANIINLEENLEFEICFKRNDMFDYNPERSDYENWVPFTLGLNLPNRHSRIEENAKATMTIFEIKKLIYGIENVLAYMESRENCLYTFNSSESFFELKLEVIPEDNVIEIELWINVGIQTKGKYSGFDEGVRFVISKDKLNNFFEDFKENYFEVTGLQISKE